MSKDSYFWCQLKNGNKETVGYIPARGAKVGAKVQLPDIDNEFWEVISVGDEKSKEYVRNNEKGYKAFQMSLSGGGIDE